MLSYLLKPGRWTRTKLKLCALRWRETEALSPGPTTVGMERPRAQAPSKLLSFFARLRQLCLKTVILRSKATKNLSLAFYVQVRPFAALRVTD